MVLLLAGWAAGFVVSGRGLEVKDGFRVCGKDGTAAPLGGTGRIPGCLIETGICPRLRACCGLGYKGGRALPASRRWSRSGRGRGRLADTSRPIPCRSISRSAANHYAGWVLGVNGRFGRDRRQPFSKNVGRAHAPSGLGEGGWTRVHLGDHENLFQFAQVRRRS